MTGLDSLVGEVRSESQFKVRKLKSEAEVQVKAIIAEAELQANELLLASKSQAELVAEGRTSMISSSRLKAKQLLSEGRDKAVSTAIDELRGELTRFALNTKQYKIVFARLAKQAIAELGRKDFDILVNKRDLQLAKSLGYSAKTADIIGGVIASSKDGLIRVNNSFDVLLEEKREILRMAAFQELFGKNAGNQ